MKILITGVSGFIGSVLCKELKNNTDYLVAGSARNYFDGEGVDIINVGDIDQNTDWSSALNNVSIVIHLAAHVHNKCTKNNISNLHYKVNVEGSRNLAEQAVLAGVKRFIYLSSIGVHGVLTSIEQPINASSPFSPYDDYTKSKLIAEQSLQSITRNSLMELVVIRPPMVYGYDAPGNFRSLVKLLNLKLPLPFKSINNKRSFIAIDNLIDFIITCIKHPQAAVKSFVVSDDFDLSTSDLLGALNKSLDRPSILFSIPEVILKLVFSMLGKRKLYKKICGSLIIDIAESKQLLNWSPKTTFNMAIQKSVRQRL